MSIHILIVDLALSLVALTNFGLGDLVNHLSQGQGNANVVNLTRRPQASLRSQGQGTP